MSDLNCYYHPNLKAKEKCKVCGKLLCQQCSTQHKHVDGMPPPPPPSLPRWKMEDGKLKMSKRRSTVSGAHAPPPPPKP